MKLSRTLIVFLTGLLLAGCAGPNAMASGGPQVTPSLPPVGTVSPGSVTTSAPPIVGVGSGPGTATPDPAGSPRSVTPPSSNELVVTLADAGNTFILPVGERFLLKLGEEYSWEVISSDQNILRRVPNVMVIRGAQGLYEGHQAGQVQLTATGDPLCRQSTPPCMMPSRVFTITVIVKG